MIIDAIQTLYILIRFYLSLRDTNRDDTYMKMRYYEDPNIEFTILGVDTGAGMIEPLHSIPDKDAKYKTLKSAAQYILSSIEIRHELNNIYKSTPKDKCKIIVLMDELSHDRNSKPDNILYFCESALFRFNQFMKCDSAVFNFRKTKDPLLESAELYYTGDNVLYYKDTSVVAGKYFKECTPDRELAQFILHNHKRIVY